MQQELQFKISSALKNIIGRDLINDDFIAVFELVKNSYDAHATRVDIYFEDIYGSNPKIIIKDNGKGMNYNDLINKWLFVAYSAKKEGTEEDSFDYRDRIKVKRAYAGAKGIGRFSCDRLGSTLLLQSKKEETNAKIETLLTDWEKFESDLKDEFINISVLHETRDDKEFNLDHGTILQITELRNNWNRDKLRELKRALARLINPNSINKADSFQIVLNVDEEKANDLLQIQKNLRLIERGKLDDSQLNFHETVNGSISNLIFETLGIKTSYIESNVRKNSITTTLFEAGKMVYKLEESNPFDDLHDIDYSIYFLNQSAKSTFTKRMGLEPVNYGHIFVYKNGLRIFPYGERGEDPLKMDNRKAQGHSRYLGTREVIGYISINGENENLRETSSRGDGLIKTNTYFHLENWFYETLKKLEKYSLEITDWGNFLAPDDFINLNETFLKNAGTENEKLLDVTSNFNKLILSLTKTKNLLSFEISPEILKKIEKKKEESATNLLDQITQKITNDDIVKTDFLNTVKEVKGQFQILQKAKEEAEEEAFNKMIENEKLSHQLSRLDAERLFDSSIIGREKEDLINLQHQIVHTAGNITLSLDELVKSINNNSPKEKLINEIKEINFEVHKILSASRYVTNAGFNVGEEKITKDIVQFISEYVSNIYQPIDSFIHKKRPIKISVDHPNGITKTLKFRPFEVTVLLDNLFSNSRKANSNSISISWSKTSNNINLSFKDDGDGIPSEIIDKIFDFGYTQTNGSGIGLFHVKRILEGFNAKISVNNKLEKGVEFLITFPL
jgi:signal transduction histidine kinase